MPEITNRAWREALGYTEEELINLNIDRVVYPEALTQCFDTLQRAMSAEQVDRIETRFATKKERKDQWLKIRLRSKPPNTPAA